MKVAAIIQARVGSTRLPGKVLKKVLGKTLLEYQIERVKRSKTIDEIIIATTTKESDNPIVQLCQQLSIPYYRGSEEDVLLRYYEAATEFNVDVVVRLTSDCPVIDPKVIDKVITYYVNNRSKYDYVSNSSYPRGMDTEVFSFRVLEEAYHKAVEQYEREHVTPFIYLNPDIYNLGKVVCITDMSHYRWTVDTPEDFKLIQKIITTLYPFNNEFTMEDILELFEKNPEWLEINSHIKQKGIFKIS